MIFSQSHFCSILLLYNLSEALFSLLDIWASLCTLIILTTFACLGCYETCMVIMELVGLKYAWQVATWDLPSKQLPFFYLIPFYEILIWGGRQLKIGLLSDDCSSYWRFLVPQDLEIREFGLLSPLACSLGNHFFQPGLSTNHRFIILTPFLP